MDIEKILKNEIIKAVEKSNLNPGSEFSFDISAPKQKGHGDFAANAALIIGSRLRMNPREVAQTIVANFDIDEDKIKSIEIAGPGFINFELAAGYLYDSLQEVLNKKERYGFCNIGKGKNTQVEFVSANPTGPLTIGHGRQAVLGDSISRLLEAAGYNVKREYYFNDAGRQMRVLGESVQMRYRELLGEQVDFPDYYYQGEYILQIAEKVREEKNDSLKNDDNTDYFKDTAEKVIFNQIRETLNRLGIIFDMFYNEKSLYETGRIDRVLDDLKDKDLIYKQDDAVWMRLSKMGRSQDKVIIKSTGEPTYRLPDIAYHRDKIERGFDLIVDIFGADHADTYPDVIAAVKALGCDTSKIKVLIHQFVTLVEGGEKVKMSTRKANFVTLDELIDQVGEDVTRYFFLNRSMSSHLNFDLKLARTQSDENPVYYVQYAHARICSILRHAAAEGYDIEQNADLSLLTAPEEISLIKAVITYPVVLKQAVIDFEPLRLTTYLENTATVYHKFQHAGKVDASLRVVTDNKQMTAARIALCRAVRVVIANGLSLLGIKRPEKM